MRVVLQYKMEQDNVCVWGGCGRRGRESGLEHKMFVKNWPEGKMISSNLWALLKHCMLYINHSFFSF